MRRLLAGLAAAWLAGSSVALAGEGGRIAVELNDLQPGDKGGCRAVFVLKNEIGKALDKMTLRVVTYNIHRSRGIDRRTRPERIAAVLQSVNADVIALQEVVGAGPRGFSHIEEIGAALGMGWVMASARHLRGHQFGNAVLSRFPITHHAQHDLSYKSCEERCMQRVDISAGGHPLHVYNVHLGTAFLERRHQAQRLATIVNGDCACTTHVPLNPDQPPDPQRTAHRAEATTTKQGAST